MPSIYVPSSARPSKRLESRCRGLFDASDYGRQRAFFADSTAFPETPLRSLPALAGSLGLGELWVKDETNRFGLPAFKGLGATFALHTLMASGALANIDTLVCASEGNHGRAVAHAARRAGLGCRVYLGQAVADARADAIRSEGATIVRVTGTYDDAVRQAAEDAAANGWQVMSDTSWPGYEEIPRQIMLGYTRLMDEAEAQWDADGPPPDLVLVQGGVGGLAGAVASWLAWRYDDVSRPRLAIVEPVDAACIQASARAGRPTAVAGPLTTIMGGLRCGEMSPLAFEAIDAVADAYLSIEDAWAQEAMRGLALPLPPDPALAVGPSGAAGLGALLAGDEVGLSTALRLRTRPRAMVIATEGPTEPALWEAVTQQRP